MISILRSSFIKNIFLPRGTNDFYSDAPAPVIFPLQKCLSFWSIFSHSHIHNRLAFHKRWYQSWIPMESCPCYFAPSANMHKNSWPAANKIIIMNIRAGYPEARKFKVAQFSTISLVSVYILQEDIIAKWNRSWNHFKCWTRQ